MPLPSALAKLATTLVTCALALIGPAVWAAPLDQSIRETVNAGAPPDTAFIRCGANYYAHLWWDSSKPNLSDDQRAIFDANMNTALTQANIIRAEPNDQGVDAVNEAIKTELRPFIVAYIKRFERNAAAAAGNTSDAMIADDLSFCQELVPS